jgi:hypothetical protein
MASWSWSKQHNTTARPSCRRRFADVLVEVTDVLVEVLLRVGRPGECLVASWAKCRTSRRRFLLSLFENEAVMMPIILYPLLLRLLRLLLLLLLLLLLRLLRLLMLRMLLLLVLLRLLLHPGGAVGAAGNSLCSALAPHDIFHAAAEASELSDPRAFTPPWLHPCVVAPWLLVSIV